jgi:hypothetical protein
MAIIEERADTLEAVLGQFIVHTDIALRRLETEMKIFQEEMRQYREAANLEMQQFREEMRQHRETTNLETQQFREEMRQFRETTNLEMQQFREEMRQFRETMTTQAQQFQETTTIQAEQFREEMRQYRETATTQAQQFQETMTIQAEQFQETIATQLEQFQETIATQTRQFQETTATQTRQFQETTATQMRQFREEAERERREMNKKWGDLANKMGTLVEDIVVPNFRGIAQRYFGCVEFDFFARAVYKTHAKDRSKRREFDVVAVCEDKVPVNETKSNPRTEYISEFVEVLKEIYDYFPEHQGKKIIPIFSSLYLPEDVVNYLTSKRIYAMAMREDTIDLLNFEHLR